MGRGSTRRDGRSYDNIVGETKLGSLGMIWSRDGGLLLIKVLGLLVLLMMVLVVSIETRGIMLLKRMR